MSINAVTVKSVFALQLLWKHTDTNLKAVSHAAHFLPSGISRCFQPSDQTPSENTTHNPVNQTAIAKLLTG